MVDPGKDGYRTPLPEDYQYDERRASDPRSQQPLGVLPTDTPPAPSTGHHLGLWGIRTPNLSNYNLAAQFERLHWKERVRHFTWTFFTMTMATGGIANVLAMGEDSVTT